MNAPPCTLKDVDQAAEELMALGCKVGALHINDGAARLGFLGEIKAFAEEVYQDIKDGVISAAEGVEALWDEHEALRGKAGFYLTNGITVAGGAAQFATGISIGTGSAGLGIPFAGIFVSHGLNNLYEGGTNIYNGPNVRSATGPIRQMYQNSMGSVHEGNQLYGFTDLTLSFTGLIRLVKKPNSFELFRRDPINYIRFYKQATRQSLTLELLNNDLTIQAIRQAQQEKKDKQ